MLVLATVGMIYAQDAKGKIDLDALSRSDLSQKPVGCDIVSSAGEAGVNDAAGALLYSSRVNNMIMGIAMLENSLYAAEAGRLQLPDDVKMAIAKQLQCLKYNLVRMTIKDRIGFDILDINTTTNVPAVKSITVAQEQNHNNERED